MLQMINVEELYPISTTFGAKVVLAAPSLITISNIKVEDYHIICIYNDATRIEEKKAVYLRM